MGPTKTSLTNMNVLLGLLNDFHVDEWFESLICFKKDFPKLEFSKAIIFGKKSDKGSYDQKAKFNEKVTLLKRDGYRPCKFIGHFENSWGNKSEQLAYLKTLAATLQYEKESGNSLFVTIASGNQNRIENLIVLSSVFGSRIFGRFNPRSTYLKDDLFEIPGEQISRTIKKMCANTRGANPAIGRTLYKEYEKCIAERSVSTELLNNLAGFEFSEKNPLNYWMRWDSIDKADKLFEAFDELRKEVENILVRALPRKQFILGPELKSRIKEKKSLWLKLLDKESRGPWIASPFSRFTDLVGLRVIFKNYADLETGVKLVKSCGDFIDKDGNCDFNPDDRTKEFGYRALHFDLKLNPAKYKDLFPNLLDFVFEVQVKTDLANTWSEAHHLLAYKETRSQPLSEDQKQRLNEQFMRAAADLLNADEKLARICEEFDPRN